MIQQSDVTQEQRHAPRSESEIFDDLRVLAQSTGALHEISSLVYRDLFLPVDRHGGGVLASAEERWSDAKLNKNEFLLLLGLMVQSRKKRTLAVGPESEEFRNRADSLLFEFHKHLLIHRDESFDWQSGQFTLQADSIGLLGREAIYYPADSFYLHQLEKFSRQRYRADAQWLQRNVGICIDSMLDIAKFLTDRINEQMTAVWHRRNTGHQLSIGELTKGLIIPKETVREKFGTKGDAFIAKFAADSSATNTGFTNPFAVNNVALAPIIEIGDYLYLPVQYRLFESIYESPFYWMMADEEYADTHAKHRGEFLERTTADLLRSVFGPESVYENVVIERSARERASDIDVLVVYGEFVIVAQAKSKRMSLRARAGNTGALETDFELAVQRPYQQALKCIELMAAGAKCVAEDGEEMTICVAPRFFPMVVLSDPFPGATLLSRRMLERDDKVTPVIWDIGMLDCIVRLLPSPVEMLLYLKCRSDAFDNVISDSEFNYLGHHIRSKLVPPPDNDLLILARDCATVVDDFMVSADRNIEADRPEGLRARLEIPIISKLLTELSNANPDFASVAIDLYDFSSDTLQYIATTIENIRKEVAATGKAIKAFSIPTEAAGITYAVTSRRNPESALAAQAIGIKHKYENKRDRWYVILDSIETEHAVDAMAQLLCPWTEDEHQAQAAKEVSKMFKSSRVESPDATVGSAEGSRPI